jgi:alpha/beta superfamily hydrolase
VAKFAERGIELVASPNPDAFGQMIKSEVDRLKKVARDANIKAE